jgi:hypothetical protein
MGQAALVAAPALFLLSTGPAAASGTCVAPRPPGGAKGAGVGGVPEVDVGTFGALLSAGVGSCFGAGCQTMVVQQCAVGLTGKLGGCLLLAVTVLHPTFHALSWRT